MRSLLVLVLAVVVGAGCARPPPRRPAYLAAAPSRAPGMTAPVPATPVPAAAKPTRSYKVRIALVDMSLLVSFVPVMRLAAENLEDDAAPAIALGYLGAYLASGPLIHRISGNGGESGPSLLRRVAYPGLVGLGGFLLGSSLNGDSGNCHNTCNLLGYLGGGLGVGVGIVAAMIHDWSQAVVPIDLPIPTVIIDRERAVIGIGGSF